MRFLLHSTLFIVVLTACNQPKNSEADNRITIGVTDSVYSNILEEQRKIWVYVPGGSQQAVFAKKKYPVVYLLDGDAHFHSVTGLIQQLSQNAICPEMIVVGIPNTDRTRDLTPSYVKEVFGDTTFTKTSGGADNFTKFIRDELIPYVDEHYPTTSYRTLIGHSFGGLFAVHAIVNYPDVFENYLSIDPSLWWDERKLSTQAQEILTKNDYSKKSLFVAVANTMDKDKSIETVETDTASNTNHIRSILAFNHAFENPTASKINYKWKYYADDSHGSVPLIAEYDALRFLFSWYAFKDLDDFFNPDFKRTPEEAIKIVNEHFQNVTEHFGYAVTPDEALINSIGYGFLQSKKPEHAYAFFVFNTVNYPQSANTFDSLGDYYLAQQDTVHAIENFKKAVDLGDLPYSKEKLKTLTSKP